jgi:glycosyltransferase involved in cell wall biosynthesis
MHAMRVVVVTGIWPPDVGGPATHAPEVARFLHEHGDAVEVVTTADAAPAPEPYRVRWVDRRARAVVRHAAVVRAVARAARHADVVYSTGMFTRAAAASRIAGRRYVLKLTGDPAFERARWRGLSHGGIEAFAADTGPAARSLRALRDWTVRGAAHVVCPSAYLEGHAVAWGAHHVTVLPNPSPRLPPLPAREELRRRYGMHGPTFAFAGRLTPQKSLDVALDALALADGTSLVVAGEGGERESLERRARELGIDERVRFLGPLSREDVLGLFVAADAVLLSSAWENHPHALVEARAVGTPVVATAVGGVAEIVVDGVNGLLVPAGDSRALAGAMVRAVGDSSLRRAALEANADRVYGRLREILADAAR